VPAGVGIKEASEDVRRPNPRVVDQHDPALAQPNMSVKVTAGLRRRVATRPLSRPMVRAAGAFLAAIRGPCLVSLRSDANHTLSRTGRIREQLLRTMIVVTWKPALAAGRTANNHDDL
jgi:hypothetical protein